MLGAVEASPEVRIERLLDLHHEYMRRLSAGAMGAWLGLELTLPQLRLLFLLVREGVQTPGALARRLRLAPSTVTGLLDRLDERGLVRRDEEPGNRRCVRAEATAEGAALIEELVAARRDQLRSVVERLGEEERGKVVEALRLMIHASGQL